MQMFFGTGRNREETQGVRMEQRNEAGRVKRQTHNLGNYHKTPQRFANGDVPLFQAYDCADPTSLKKVAFNPEDNCEPDPELTDISNVTLVILQHSTAYRHPGYSCQIVESRRIWQCGMFDHFAGWNTQSYFSIPRKLSDEECRSIKEDGVFKDQRGNKHAVKSNGATLLNYELVGKSYANHGELECEGEDFILDGTAIDAAVVHVQQRIEVKDDTIVSDKGVTKSEGDERFLPCAEMDRHCVTPEATYIWDTTIHDRCAYYKTKTFKASWVTGDDGTHVVMSTDGSLIRLIPKQKEKHCDQNIWSTNYEDIFIQDIRMTRAPWKMLDAKEISLQKYVANRDDYMYHAINQQVRDEFKAVMQTNCQAYNDADKFRFYAQQKDPGLASWVLGNGTFATIGGEVMFVYQCKEILVAPRPNAACTQAAPVIRIDKTGQRPNETLFLEPMTRRLTQHGIVTPCNHKMAPNLKAIDGRWVAYGTVTQYTTAPNEQTFKKSWTWDVNMPEIDFSSGGIYEQDMVDQTYREEPRRMMEIITALTTQIKGFHSEKPVTADMLFHSEHLYETWRNQLLGPFLSFVSYTGHFFSIAIGIYFIISFARSMFMYLQNLFVLYGIYGLTLRLFQVFCLRTSILMQFRKQKQQEKESKRQNMEKETLGEISSAMYLNKEDGTKTVNLLRQRDLNEQTEEHELLPKNYSKSRPNTPTLLRATTEERQQDIERMRKLTHELEEVVKKVEK